MPYNPYSLSPLSYSKTYGSILLHCLSIHYHRTTVHHLFTYTFLSAPRLLQVVLAHSPNPLQWSAVFTVYLHICSTGTWLDAQRQLCTVALTRTMSQWRNSVFFCKNINQLIRMYDPSLCCACCIQACKRSS